MKLPFVLSLLLAFITLPASTADTPGRPKNAILLLVDGLSWGQLQILIDDARSREVTTSFQEILAAGRTAYCMTAPLGSLVVESGAGSSAISTGAKIANRMLGQLPDGTVIPGFLDLARLEGKATGMVTTGRLTHAGPAGFLSHMALRDDEYKIARQIAGAGFDLLLGGGRDFFAPSAVAAARASGATVLFRGEEIEKASGGKILGLFAADSFPYALDRESVPRPDPVPTLERMTRDALVRLSKNPKGFVLVVESRLVDEVSHYHDASAVLAEMRRTDRTAAVLLDFVRVHPDTLLVVTTNHDTAGMGMEYRANPGQWGDVGQLARIRAQKTSFVAMFAELRRRELAGERMDGALARRVIEPNLSPDVKLSDADYESVVKGLAVGPKSAAFSYSPGMHALAKVLEPFYLMSWNTGTHTSSAVPCFGMGPGSEGLRGLLENTEVSRMMRTALSEKVAHQ